MTDQRCGTCKWWETKSPKIAQQGKLTVGTCRYYASAKRPMWMHPMECRTMTDWGTACSVYAPKTEENADG